MILSGYVIVNMKDLGRSLLEVLIVQYDEDDEVVRLEWMNRRRCWAFILLK